MRSRLHLHVTNQRFADQIDPFPKNLNKTLPVLETLGRPIIDPVIDEFGRDRLHPKRI